MKESAEQLKDGRNVASHESKRWPGIFIRVVLFPAAIILGALWKYRRNLRFDLHSDEILLKSELVTMQGEKKLDGRLFLTNQRVVFKADDRSVTIDVTLSSIEGTSIRRAKLLGIPTAGKVICIHTDRGKSLDVIPRSADDWAEAIGKQLFADSNQ